MDAIASGDSYLPDVVLAEVDLVLRCYVLDRQSRYELVPTPSPAALRGFLPGKNTFQHQLVVAEISTWMLWPSKTD